jgi:lipoprotein NlpI
MKFYIKLFILSFCLPLLANSQESKEIYYKDAVLAKVVWYDQDLKKDSLKTYYNSGELNEVFNFNDQEEFHGVGYKYNKTGEKITTWIFKNNKLLNRIDHKIEFNSKNEKRVTSNIRNIKKLNEYLKDHNANERILYSQAHTRYRLFNTTLALEGFKKLEESIENGTTKFSHKQKAGVYDCLGSIYSGYEMKDYAIHYKLKSVATSPAESRLYNNLGGYLVTIKSYRLGISYLNKALNFSKKHNFANWNLARAYSDLEEYEKAMACITLTFENEASLYRLGSGTAERDIRTIRGWLYHKLGDSKKGILDLEEALKINSNNSFALRNLGILYHDLGEFDKSCELLQKSKELGYEKTHDRDDLQVYIDASCSNKKKKEDSYSHSTLPYIHPNPAKNSIKIENYEYSNFNYEIYNYSAQLIKTGVSIENNIDVTNLDEGLYVLKILNSDAPQEFKLIKI